MVSQKKESIENFNFILSINLIKKEIKISLDSVEMYLLFDVSFVVLTCSSVI